MKPTSVRAGSPESVEVTKAASATRFTDPGKVETREYDAVRFLCAVAGVDGSKSLMAKGEKLVSLTFASWNQMASWLSQLQGLQGAASSSGQEFTNHFQLSGR